MLLRSTSTLVLLFLSLQLTTAQTLKWSTPVDSVATFSSPRAVDLNGDNVLDVVVGAGYDGSASAYGVQALDGATGAVMWSFPAVDDIFGTPVFQDINNDLIPDVFIGGRQAQLYAIDGSNGAMLWEFWPYQGTIAPKDSGWYNFYTPQIVPDQNSDNLPDLLVANGGDHSLAAWDTIRDPGHLMVLDIATGGILAKAAMPDGRETYCSPVVSDVAGNGTLHVVFGSGGETINGSLWMAELVNDVMSNDLSNAIELVHTPDFGFVAPPAIADLNMDGRFDIVAQAYNGTAYAIDGSNQQILWSVNVPGTESSTEPVIGNFTGYMEPDVFFVMNQGTAPTFFDHYQVMVDGATGQIAWIDSISDLHFATPNAFDANGDGRDEVMASVNYFGASATHELILIDFQNDTVTSFWGPHAGLNLACTPLVQDIDGSGYLDVVFPFRTDSAAPFLPNGIRIDRLSTTMRIPATGVAWGSYIGSNFDGHYTYDTLQCPGFVGGVNLDNESCNDYGDGSISLNPNGGTAPYTAIWGDGSMGMSLTGLTAGDYDVTITDSMGCVISGTLTLNEPYLVTFGGQIDNPCPGDSVGSVTVNSTGCPCMFSGCVYDWTNGDSTKYTSGNPAGDAVVTILMPNGCITVDTVVFTEGPAVIDSMDVQNLSCLDADDGRIKLFPSFGTNVTYQWDTGDSTAAVNNLAEGTYEVIVSDNRPCVDTVSITVNAPDTLTMTASNTNVTCYGDDNGTITLNGAGGTGALQYVMDGSAYSANSWTGLAPGTYAVMVMDSLGCYSDSMDITITEPAELEINSSVVHETDAGMADGTATASASGGTMPYAYLWDDASNQTTETATGLSSGTYTVTVTDSNGCAAMDTVYIAILTSTEEQFNTAGFQIYPNPVDEYFTVDAAGVSSYDLIMFDMEGRVVLEEYQLQSQQVVIERGDLPGGVYLVRLRHANGVSDVSLILK